MIEATPYFFIDLSFINTAHLGPSLFLVIPPVLTYVTKYQVTSSHTNACLVLDESNNTWQQQWLIRKRAGAPGQGGGGRGALAPMAYQFLADLSPPKCLSFRRPWKAIQINAGAPEWSLVPIIFFAKGPFFRGGGILDLPTSFLGRDPSNADRCRHEGG